jgi:hypothetical protein
MTTAADEARCKHGLIATMCGESGCLAAPQGLPDRVWRTQQGLTYHRSANCQALIDGQLKARRRGREAHEAERVPLSQAIADGLAECFHCFPDNVPPDAKPCQARIGGRWTDAYLLRWRRGPDGRWKGVVNYRHGAERRVAILDQDELRPARA